MNILAQQFIAKQTARMVPDIRPGDTVRIHQLVKEGDKTRSQVFEGVVIARKHGSGINATITVRKISFGVGVERIFPLHSPLIEKIEIVKRAKVRRAKLYYLRGLRGRKARMKAKEFEAIVYEDVSEEKKEVEENAEEGKTTEEETREQGGGGGGKEGTEGTELNTEGEGKKGEDTKGTKGTKDEETKEGVK